MKYSFVLPAYKGDFFRDAVNSILSQTYIDFELVIVDDCSPVDLRALISDRLDDCRITYYRNEVNVGSQSLVYQWNKSISKAKGEYVILASDDDLYDKDYLMNMDKLIGEFKQAKVFRPHVTYINSLGEAIGSELNVDGILSREEYLELFLEGSIFSGVPQYVFCRETLMESGGFVDFPLAWFSDDATILLMSSGGIACSSTAKFYFRKSSISLSNVRGTASVVIKKIVAAIKYHQFLEQIEGMSNEKKAGLIKRIRYQSFYLLKDNSFMTLCKSLIVIHKGNVGELFPRKWQIKAVLSNIKNHFSTN